MEAITTNTSHCLLGMKTLYTYSCIHRVIDMMYIVGIISRRFNVVNCTISSVKRLYGMGDILLKRNHLAHRQSIIQAITQPARVQRCNQSSV